MSLSAKRQRVPPVVQHTHADGSGPLGDEGYFIVELFRAGAGLSCWRIVVTL